MSKHTPGPWELIKQRAPNGGAYWDITEHDRQAHDRIAMCGPWTASRCGIEAAANARLISAAPDLLAALEQMLDADGDLYAMDFDMCRAAIRKAKGE